MHRLVARRIRPRGAQRGVRRPGAGLRPRPRPRPRAAQRERRGDRARPPARLSGARIITTLVHELRRRGASAAWRRCASAWARGSPSPWSAEPCTRSSTGSGPRCTSATAAARGSRREHDVRVPARGRRVPHRHAGAGRPPDARSRGRRLPRRDGGSLHRRQGRHLGDGPRGPPAPRRRPPLQHRRRADLSRCAERASASRRCAR